MIQQKKDICREFLIESILTLEIEPGRMLDEAQLCQEFELSRTPMRELFQTLAGEGYLALVKNRGAKVSSMDLDSMRNFFQSAPMIYSAIGKLAVENAQPEQITTLREVQTRFRATAEEGDARTMAIHNHRFHELIGEMAGNPYLSPSLNRLLIDHTRMSQKFFSPANSKERLIVWKACDQHDAMIDAIEDGDGQKIVELSMEHWALSKDRIEKFVRPDPLDIELGETG